MRGPAYVHGVFTTRDGYLMWHATKIAMNRQQAPGHYGAIEVHSVKVPLVVYINDGRWVGNCSCGSGVSVSPEWRLGCCASCGAIYEQLTLPGDSDDIVEALEKRPVPNQNWNPGESVDQLLIENAEHSIDLGEVNS